MIYCTSTLAECLQGNYVRTAWIYRSVRDAEPILVHEYYTAGCVVVVYAKIFHTIIKSASNTKPKKAVGHWEFCVEHRWTRVPSDTAINFLPFFWGNNEWTYVVRPSRPRIFCFYLYLHVILLIDFFAPSKRSSLEGHDGGYTYPHIAEAAASSKAHCSLFLCLTLPLDLACAHSLRWYSPNPLPCLAATRTTTTEEVIDATQGEGIPGAGWKLPRKQCTTSVVGYCFCLLCSHDSCERL